MSGGRAGQVVDGRFQLIAPLGRGGMGTVWRARDLALEREVALKEVRPPDPGSGREGQDLRERVLREARALARVSHPNVVTIHHIVDIAPHPWLVMELLPGRTLETVRTAGPLAPAEAARYGRDVLAALCAAHAGGIHHRDVKPANVLLREDGSAVLTDFGIAAVAGSSSLTVTGGIVGSPEYMAPERARGGRDLPASDLWSLGMMLYVLVEGRSPMRRDTVLATLTAVLEDPVPVPVRAGQLAPVLAAVLVKNPELRPDAGRLDAMLSAVAQGRAGPPPGPPPPPPGSPALPTAPSARQDTQVTAPRPTPHRRRTTVLAGLVAAALLLAGATTAGLLLAANGGDSGGGTGGDSGGTGGDSGGELTRPDTPPATDGTADGETGTDRPDEDLTDGENGSPEGGQESGRPSPDLTVAVPGQESADSWIAQLFSEPVASGAQARDRALAAVRAEVPEALVLRSDDFASLNPGYWVIYAPGPFAGGQEALRFCAERGRTTPNECVGRYLSHRHGDIELICHPERGENSRCER
ncbi:hypothetical protein GCM10009716_30790 [Streptomyces sodiiphilus]|uniref:non-specific serine/threonine protein kinase n=1 Tax=Streptomyces sodiiphilus TaxID=226217 RepID=A0ABP5AQC8_9ACTN